MHPVLWIYLLALAASMGASVMLGKLFRLIRLRDNAGAVLAFGIMAVLMLAAFLLVHWAMQR